MEADCVKGIVSTGVPKDRLTAALVCRVTVLLSVLI